MQAEKIVFDLEKPPLTGAQLQQAVTQLDKVEKASIQRAGFMVIIFVAVTTWATAIFFNFQGPGISFLYWMFICFFTSGLFALVWRTEQKGSAIETRLARLRAIPPEGNADGYLELADLARKDPSHLPLFPGSCCPRAGGVPVLGELEAADGLCGQLQAQSRAVWEGLLARTGDEGRPLEN